MRDFDIGGQWILEYKGGTMEISDASNLARIFVRNLGKYLTGFSESDLARSALEKAAKQLPDDDVKKEILENFQHYENMLDSILNGVKVEGGTLKMVPFGLSSGPSSVDEILRTYHEKSTEITPQSLIYYLQFADNALPYEICRCVLKMTSLGAQDFEECAALLGTRMAFNSGECRHPQSVACINAFIIVSRYINSSNVECGDWYSPLILSTHHREAPLLHVAFICYWLHQASLWGLTIPACSPLLLYTMRSLDIASKTGDISRGEPIDMICIVLLRKWLSTFPESRERQSYSRLLTSLQGMGAWTDVQSFILDTISKEVVLDAIASRGGADGSSWDADVLSACWKCIEHVACRRRAHIADELENHSDAEIENDDENWEKILNLSQFPKDSKSATGDAVDIALLPPVEGGVGDENDGDEAGHVGFMMDTTGDTSIIDQLGDVGANDDEEVHEEDVKKNAKKGKKRGAMKSSVPDRDSSAVVVDTKESLKRPQRKSKRNKN